MSGYPRNFLWGAATAGHQIEGSNVNADIWLLEQVPETQFREPSGDACDSLNRWREDLGLVRRMGLNAYRFSVEWSRIEPVAGQFSRAWLDHYSAIAAECTACGLAPVITLSHFTSPRWFAAEGGWSNLRAAGQFGRFAGTVAQAVGRDASHIVTFNEPNLPLMGRWATTPLADPVRSGLDAMLAGAAKACGGEAYDVWVYSRGDDARLANLIAGHRAARDAIRAEFPGLPVGMSLALPDVQGVGGDAGVAAYRRFAEDPFFAAARDDDFIGVQNYGRLRVSPSAVVPAPTDAEKTQTGDEFYPQGLGPAIARAHAATGKPVLVTENGIATADDTQRQRFLEGAFASLDEQVIAGVPVAGYFHWSLMDNFEWRRGYSQQFGLVAVDRSTFRRSAKPSARTLSALVEKRS